LAVPGAIDFKIKGYCSFCRRPSVFLSSYMYAGSTYPNGNLEPNWREHLQCESCKLVTRLRFLFHVLDSEFSYSSSSRVYVSERLTEFYSRLESIFPSIIGSEYLSESATPGELYEGIRHENIESLSFDSGMFDLVISCDVLEHVLDYKAAIASIFDVLDEGGTALFTAPFDFDSMDHETRAVITNGSRVDLMEPEYHGNPVDPEGGSFCWRYYGWVLLEELKACGFKDVSLFAGWSPEFAYLGRPQIVIAATK